VQNIADQPQQPQPASNTRRAPGSNEIVLPISLQEYERFARNPADFRQLLNEQFNAHPELFPREFGEDGFQLKDIVTSVKMGIRIRRITVGFPDQSHNYRVLPSNILPSMCGRTEDVTNALFLRKFNVPFWVLEMIFGRDANYYYRLETRMGKSSIVGALHGPKGELPEDLCCDEKHSKHFGDKVFITTTVGAGCVLGAHLCEAADAESLAEGYGVVREEMARSNPQHKVRSINIDGFAATTAALRIVFGPAFILITCFLHLYIAIRDGAKKKHGELFREIADRLWDAYDAPVKELFTQKWKDLMAWCKKNSHRIPERIATKLANADKNKLQGYEAWYDCQQGHRVSSALDREMGSLDRRLFAMRYLHGHWESSNLMIRAWAHLHNFAPWNPKATKLHGAECPAERLTGYRYRKDWLENFRVASSLQGYRYYP
jgi:hypothetical protein